MDRRGFLGLAHRGAAVVALVCLGFRPTRREPHGRSLVAEINALARDIYEEYVVPSIDTETPLATMLADGYEWRTVHQEARVVNGRIGWETVHDSRRVYP